MSPCWSQRAFTFAEVWYRVGHVATSRTRALGMSVPRTTRATRSCLSVGVLAPQPPPIWRTSTSRSGATVHPCGMGPSSELTSGTFSHPGNRNRTNHSRYSDQARSYSSSIRRLLISISSSKAEGRAAIRRCVCQIGERDSERADSSRSRWARGAACVRSDELLVRIRLDDVSDISRVRPTRNPKTGLEVGREYGTAEIAQTTSHLQRSRPCAATRTSPVRTRYFSATSALKITARAPSPSRCLAERCLSIRRDPSPRCRRSGTSRGRSSVLH